MGSAIYGTPRNLGDLLPAVEFTVEHLGTWHKWCVGTCGFSFLATPCFPCQPMVALVGK